jgi:hypothetical protein
MDFNSSDNSDAKFSGTVRTQIFKQFKSERLIKEDRVIPATKLVEAKGQGLQRVKDFELTSEDKRRHRTTATIIPKDKLNCLPLTREPFEE